MSQIGGYMNEVLLAMVAGFIVGLLFSFLKLLNRPQFPRHLTALK
jgi:xanthosine utilization system XapX-like protein